MILYLFSAAAISFLAYWLEALTNEQAVILWLVLFTLGALVIDATNRIEVRLQGLKIDIERLNAKVNVNNTSMYTEGPASFGSYAYTTASPQPFIGTFQSLGSRQYDES